MLLPSCAAGQANLTSSHLLPLTTFPSILPPPLTLPFPSILFLPPSLLPVLLITLPLPHPIPPISPIQWLLSRGQMASGACLWTKDATTVRPVQDTDCEWCGSWLALEDATAIVSRVKLPLLNYVQRPFDGWATIDNHWLFESRRVSGHANSALTNMVMFWSRYFSALNVSLNKILS